MAIGAIIGGVAQIAGGIIGGAKARKAARRARKKLKQMNAKMAQLEANRQEIINPYEGAENLSDMMSNPMANLGVATQATEMQIEQTDQALANTLDTLRQTGGGAGSATALAQAALQSKQNVAAGIEQQEKANEDKAAAGEQRAQQQKIAEEQRMQQAGAMGKQFVFGETEKRQVKEMDRTYAELMGTEQDRAQAKADQTGAITGALGSIASIGGGMLG